jgi:uncharacterized membrane protein
MLFLPYQSNSTAAIRALLKNMGMNVDSKVIVDALEKHPDHPSLLTISDVLADLRLENEAIRTVYEEMVSLPTPFIAYTNSKGGSFVAVTAVDQNHITLSNEQWQDKQFSKSEFLKIFADIVLTAKLSASYKPVKEALIPLNAQKQLLFAFMISLFTISFFYQTGYFNHLTWPVIALTLIKGAGLFTSLALLGQSFNNQNPLIRKFCKGGGNIDCNAILSSKAANVFPGLSWSEVGFYYFAGTGLLLLCSAANLQALQVLLLLNLLCLPYTAYSIYYQAYVAKKWCPFCCLVQGVLWLECLPLLYNYLQYPAGNVPLLNLALLTKVAICLLLPVITWLLIRPMMLKQQQIIPLKEQLKKIKFHPGIFNHLHMQHPACQQPLADWSIVLGNSTADNILTMVSNPYCEPCAQTHRLIEELIGTGSNIQVRIIFSGSNAPDDKRTPIGSHLIALYDRYGATIVQEALHGWYTQHPKNYAEWAKQYPVAITDDDHLKLELQKKWCYNAVIKGTPTLFFNGRLLPELYQVGDLRYLV